MMAGIEFVPHEVLGYIEQGEAADAVSAELTKRVADPVKFVHIREQEAWVNVAYGIVDYYPAPNGGVTIAYVMDADEGQSWHIRFAVAQCSPRDNYNKKVGRAIARGRLDAACTRDGKFVSQTLWVSDGSTGAEITNAVITAALAYLDLAGAH
jgi:hypothetical protein